MKKILIFILFVTNISVFSQQWTQLPDIHKYSFTRALNASNNMLFAEGGFYSTDSVLIYSIGYWDSICWNQLQNISAVIHSILVFNNQVYIGGGSFEYTNFNNIACFNGTNWIAPSTIGSPNTDVTALIKYKNKLILGGGFSYIGSSPYGSLATWNDTVYNTIGSCNHVVNCFAIFNNSLIVGGNYQAISGNLLYNIASYDGSHWNPLGYGLGGYVAALSVDTINNFLYAGGYVYGGEVTPFSSCVARWDGEQWTGVGTATDLDCDVLALGMYKKYLYAGGCFGIQDSASTCPYKGVARWDGSLWNTLGSGVNNTVYALAEYKGELYVGGEYSIAGGDSARGLARWYIPVDTSCNWLQPRVFSNTDTISLNGQGQAQVQFFNNNAYAQNWQWNFGDSGTDSIKNPLHTFTDTGTFTIQVTVTMDGCVKTAIKNIVVLQYNSISNNEYRMSNIELRIYPNPANSNFTAEIFIPLIERSRNERAA
ncbi:MAG: PKD domain-containing protein, partial [Bacteroidia bacterium]|nr:PKD domain-containing protein [Bacteroidia bacterium]